MRVARRLLVASLVLALGAPVSAQTATINFSDTKQQIDGFGAANGHQGLTAPLADLFFTTVGISLFRLPFSSGGSGAYESESATFYADAGLAAARGALVWAAPWTASPAAWKNNNNLVAGTLNTGHYGDWATKMAGLAADLKAQSNVTLYAMSAGNEPDFTAPYESMLWDASAITTFIGANLGPSLAGLTPKVKLIAPETENWDHGVSYAATIQADSTATGYTDILATHQYEGTVTPITTSKHVWETEMSTIGGTFDGSIADGLTVAGWIHAAIVTGGVNAWHYWWTRNDQANNLGLIGNAGDDTLTKRLYVLGQYAKFIRPGWFRAGVTLASVPAGVSISAFKSNHNAGMAVVVINASGSSQTITYTLQGLTPGAVTPYVTSSTQDLAALAPVTVTAGSFSATVANSTVTTFVGTLTPPTRRRNRR